MRTTIYGALLVACVLTSACSKSSDDKSTDTTTPNAQTTDASNKSEPSATTGSSHVLQMTVLNFLKGGFESCDVKNKIFSFSSNDRNLEVPICENSRVKVYATSDSGRVTFHAVDILSGAELPASHYSSTQSLELGKTEGMLRYGVENPYGFTYVMAEEVTGIDPKLLEEWNQLRGRAAELRAQILTAEQQGKKAPQAALKELAEIEVQIDILSQKMQRSN